MIIVNFTHPLTDAQRARIEELTGVQDSIRVIDALAHFDDQAPFAEQTRRLVDSIPLSSGEWQTEPILVVPPALNFIAVAVLAELHGRMGYFPAVVRVRPVPDTLPRVYEVAELLDLQAVRDGARSRR